MSSRKRRKRRPARRAWWPDLDLPVLEQRHWDVIGLGLVAFAAFFACVFYLDWAGGEVGEALAGAILFMLGGVGYAAPVLLFAAGALIVIRPMMPALHPLKTGAVCLTSALMLGLAAGSLGLGPGDTPRDGFLDPQYLKHHGGREAVLDRGLAHPVRLPAAGRRAAPHGSVDREHHHGDARGRAQHHRARPPHDRDRAHPVPAAAPDRASGARRPRAGCARDARRGAGAG